MIRNIKRENRRDIFMIKEFNVLTKIKLTDGQNDVITNFIYTVLTNDITNNVNEVLLSLADVKDGILNEYFCPIIVLKNDELPDALYEGVKEQCSLIPEYVSREEEIPSLCVTLWKK